MALFNVAAKRRSGAIARAVLCLTGCLAPFSTGTGAAEGTGESVGPQSVQNYAPLERLAADAVNAFSLELFRNIAKEDGGNVAVSPYSLNRALAVAAYGASGETRAELLA